MNDLVLISGGKAVVSSKDVADKFEKKHRNVLIDIRKLDCSDNFREQHYLPSTYTSLQNKELPAFDMTRDGFSFLCMGFIGKKAAAWKEKYINAFNEMEAQLIARPATMAALNELTRKIEGDSHSASICGQSLAKYKALKKENEEEFTRLVDEAQLSLGFKVESKIEH